MLLGLTPFPLLAVVSISLRQGNFATGTLLPDTIGFEHWQWALGKPYTRADGTLVQPPFPLLLWLWNSVRIATISALLIVACLGGVAMPIWTIKGNFEPIPQDIAENAEVDGTTHWQAFRFVLLPIAVPILMVVFVPACIGTITEYPVASIMLREEPNRAGTPNNWAALDDYAFQYRCDAYYLNVKLSGCQEFEVTDAAWQPASTFGVGAGNFEHTFSGDDTVRVVMVETKETQDPHERWTARFQYADIAIHGHWFEA